LIKVKTGVLGVAALLLQYWSPPTATKMTPFMAIYGYHPTSITSYLRENSKFQAVEGHIENQ